MAGAYPGFCSMKQLRVLLLPRGWDASPSRGYPQQYVTGTHFIHLGGERQCGKECSSPRKQHVVRDWASNPRPSELKFNALTATPPRPQNVKCYYLKWKYT